jgi:formylglycine-generating enzyme required for sulfatase activity
MTIRPSASLIAFVAIAASLYAARSQSDEPAKTEKTPVDPMLGKEAGDVRDDNGLKMKLVWCPPGFFDMGTGTALPKTRVFLTRGYWLGKYEVTQSEWKQLMAAVPWKDQPGEEEGDDFPATHVDWNGAMEFCRRLTDVERRRGRLPEGWDYSLPTEAQWERACRARTETRFSFGDDQALLGDHAWFDENRGEAQHAQRVGGKKSNPWGLFDMHGNVYEWCRDWFDRELPGGRDPEVTVRPDAQRRVVRGGSWVADTDSCAAGSRTIVDEALRSRSVGFRIALTPVQPPK